MAPDWPDVWSVDCVSKLPRADRRTLFHGVADPFRVGSSLREFPCRPIQEYLLLRSRGQLIGLHGILRVPVRINETPYDVGGVSAFYLVPQARGRGWSKPFHHFTRERIRSWGVAGVLGFCQPAVLPIYLRFGATALGLRPLIAGRYHDGYLPSPQPLFWWPFRDDVMEIRSLDIQGQRW